MVGKYLIASYLYYECDHSIMEDSEFDQICKTLLENFDHYHDNHPHGHLLDRDALSAGTGHHIRPGQYPTIVRHIAHQVIEWHRKGRDYLRWLEDKDYERATD